MKPTNVDANQTTPATAIDPNLTTPAVDAKDGCTSSSSQGERAQAGLRFQVLRPHARGGLGEVFLARDGELDREVALKEMREEFADDSGCCWQFWFWAAAVWAGGSGGWRSWRRRRRRI